MSGRDPRFRPYRRFLWAVYFACVLLGVGLVIVSVVRHLYPPQRAAAAAASTRAPLRACLTDLEALSREQHERAWTLGATLDEARSFDAWSAWAQGWSRRLDELSARCGLDAARDPADSGSAARVELAAARDAVKALHRAYEAQASRFAAEQGELVRGAAAALAQARAAVAAAR